MSFFQDRQKDKVAVENLSLAVGHCECFGLLGPNGAGKTTSLRMMQGVFSQILNFL